MAVCLVVDATGYFKADPAPPADQGQCAYVLMSGTETAGMTNLFSIPTTAELQTVWMLGFSMPIILYLWAFLVGKVAGMWDETPP